MSSSSHAPFDTPAPDLEAFEKPNATTQVFETTSSMSIGLKRPWTVPTARHMLTLLKPSIFSSSSFPIDPVPSSSAITNVDNTLQKSRGATAYLDGLRGWAAFLVYISHHMLGTHMSLPLELGYGHDGKYLFVTMPFVRTLFSGSHMAVHIFFVISGYVLSRGTLKNIRDRGVIGEKIASTLASAVCRRFVRLWTPVAGSTFLAMTVGYLVNQRGEEQCTYYLAEVMRWVSEMSVLAFPMSAVNWMDYNPHTWTIPYEFRGSIYVFLALLATHKMTQRARMGLFAVVAAWTHYNGTWGCSTFLIGAFLAELDLLEDHEWPQWNWLLFLQRHKVKVFVVLILFALHLAGQPMLAFGTLPGDQYLNTYGFYHLGKCIPRSYIGRMNDFWYSIGAVIIVVATTNLPPLRALFETRFTQYLGRISFGFYLVHGPVLFILGDRLYAATGASLATQPPRSHWNHLWTLSNAGPVGLEFNFVICHVLLLPLTFYLAELCTKFLDEPSIRLSRDLYLKTLAS